MSVHETFKFRSTGELVSKISSLELDIKLAKDTKILHKHVTVGRYKAPNALAILPMEGCDSLPNGGPSDLVVRRYVRFASGGAGLIWWEANAVVEEGKANPLQMMLTSENVHEFSQLINQCNKVAKEKNGYAPLHILQLTHSGRYSRPSGHIGTPIIPQHDPILDKQMGMLESYPLVTDEYLDNLIEQYVHSAKLAYQAGFHGVDIKSCHRYLLSELLAARTRGGKYGGSFANRSRLLLDIIGSIRKELGEDFIIASRFNVFDAHPYPYGFGCTAEDMWSFDDTEPLQLTKALCSSGVNLLSTSAGNPYYKYPQVTRPFDISNNGTVTPNEHPLESIARLFSCTQKVQDIAGSIPVVGNGYSWLREFFPAVAAANIMERKCSFVGIGRLGFAYPSAPKDILEGRQLDPKRCCITCSKCTQIMRNHGKTGCVLRDSKVYSSLYRKSQQEAEKRGTL